jgi:3-methyladenine DNA glycosylase AlkD
MATAWAKDAANGLEGELGSLGDPLRAESEKRYLKSDLAFFGVAVPATRRVTVAFVRANAGLDHDALTALVEELWAREHFECRMVAVGLLVERSALLGPDDLALVESLIRRSHTWALVDTLAADIAGALVQRFPELANELDRWATDPDFWVRRSALLALLLPLRRGGGDFDRFARYADAMLDEREFFIRKAIGWVLRETGKRRPDLVFEWIAPRTQRASGVTMAEVVRRLPSPQGETLMRAFREKRAAV